MQHQSPTDDPLAQIEQVLAATEQMLQHQTATLHHLQEQLDHSIRRSDWYTVQFSEMIRTLAQDLRELRTVLIWSVVNEAPVSTEMLHTMLRPTRDNQDTPPAPRRPD